MNKSLGIWSFGPSYLSSSQKKDQGRISLEPSCICSIDTITWTSFFLCWGWRGWGWIRWTLTMAHWEIVFLASIIPSFQHVFGIVAFWKFSRTWACWTCIAFSVVDTLVEKSFDFSRLERGRLEVFAAGATSTFGILAFTTAAASTAATTNALWLRTRFIVFCWARTCTRSRSTATWSTTFAWFRNTTW